MKAEKVFQFVLKVSSKAAFSFDCFLSSTQSYLYFFTANSGSFDMQNLLSLNVEKSNNTEYFLPLKLISPTIRMYDARSGENISSQKKVVECFSDVKH